MPNEHKSHCFLSLSTDINESNPGGSHKTALYGCAFDASGITRLPIAIPHTP